jgi:D-amino-acid dehydrogenase
VATPIGDRLRFAGTMEFAGMDLRMRDHRAEAALRGGRAVLNSPGEPQEVERWCGLRPCTPDGIPIVDCAPGQPKVWVACGHGMLGYTLGPVTGKLVSEMIAGQPVSFPRESLSLRRFE